MVAGVKMQDIITLCVFGVGGGESPRNDSWVHGVPGLIREGDFKKHGNSCFQNE